MLCSASNAAQEARESAVFPACRVMMTWRIVDRDHAVGMYIMLRRRAAAAFMRTKPSGRMDARSLARTVLVMRFHRRIRRRSRRLVVEREGLGLGVLHTRTMDGRGGGAGSPVSWAGRGR